mmetsp:Transcript_9435/g.16739  ORF Transcript_9435/g.16739 Transcript_9435/m.16739 type:complete len:209 (+) Transcript_9435:342-968(+)
MEVGYVRCARSTTFLGDLSASSAKCQSPEDFNRRCNKQQLLQEYLASPDSRSATGRLQQGLEQQLRAHPKETSHRMPEPGPFASSCSVSVAKPMRKGRPAHPAPLAARESRRSEKSHRAAHQAANPRRRRKRIRKRRRRRKARNRNALLPAAPNQVAPRAAPSNWKFLPPQEPQPQHRQPCNLRLRRRSRKLLQSFRSSRPLSPRRSE